LGLCQERQNEKWKRQNAKGGLQIADWKLKSANCGAPALPHFALLTLHLSLFTPTSCTSNPALFPRGATAGRGFMQLASAPSRF
jgi:hypothetical protein